MLKKIERYLNQFPIKKQVSDINARSHKSLISFVDLICSWDRIVGEKLIKVSLPQRVYRKTLYIVVNHPSYAQHLKLLQDELLARIFKSYPELKNEFKDIKFFYSEKVFKDQTDKREYENQRIQAKTLEVKEVFNLHDPKIKHLYKQAQKIYQHVDKEYRENFISLHIQNTLN